MKLIKLIHPDLGIIAQQSGVKNCTKKLCLQWKYKYGMKYFECFIDVEDVLTPVRSIYFKKVSS